MSLILFVLSLCAEILMTATYCLVLGSLAMLAIVIVAPLAIVGEFFLFLTDLVRPAAPPAS
jgi:hypothetical protein